MPESYLVDDTPFCSTIKRDGLRSVGLTYLLNKQGSNITLDITLDGVILQCTKSGTNVEKSVENMRRSLRKGVLI